MVNDVKIDIFNEEEAIKEIENELLLPKPYPDKPTNNTSNTNAPFMVYLLRKGYMKFAWIETMFSMWPQGLFALLLIDKAQKGIGMSPGSRIPGDAFTSFFAGEGKRALVWSLGEGNHQDIANITIEDLKKKFDPSTYTVVGFIQGSSNLVLTIIASATFGGLAVVACEETSKLLDDYKLTINGTDVTHISQEVLNHPAFKGFFAILSFNSNLVSFTGITRVAYMKFGEAKVYLTDTDEMHYKKSEIRYFIKAQKLELKDDFDRVRRLGYQQSDVREFQQKWEFLAKVNWGRYLDTQKKKELLDLITTPTNNVSKYDLEIFTLNTLEKDFARALGFFFTIASAAGLYNFFQEAATWIGKFIGLVGLEFLVQNYYVRLMLNIFDYTAMSFLSLIATYELGVWLAETLIYRLKLDYNIELHTSNTAKLIITIAIGLFGAIIGATPNAYQAIVLAKESILLTLLAFIASTLIEVKPLIFVAMSIAENFIRLFAKFIPSLINPDEQLIIGITEAVYGALTSGENLSDIQKQEVRDYFEKIQILKKKHDPEVGHQNKFEDDYDDVNNNNNNNQPPANKQNKPSACWVWTKSCTSSMASCLTYVPSTIFNNLRGYKKVQEIPTSDFDDEIQPAHLSSHSYY